MLVGESETYSLAQALPSIQVPATVQAVLAARIDRLPLPYPCFISPAWPSRESSPGRLR